MMTLGVGAIFCMAPEVMESNSYGMPADIFSCGILLHELASGLQPHKTTRRNEAQLVVAICRGLRPPLDALPPDAQSPWLGDLLEELWHAEPGRRLEASELYIRLEALLVAPR